MNSNRFTSQQIADARAYWGDLTMQELNDYHKHYTTGAGKGMFSGVGPETTFNDYLVLSAAQSEFEEMHDL